MILATHRGRRALLAWLAAAAVAAPLAAQAPKDPPPWWGIADDDTVNLFWDFDNQNQPFVPTLSIVPPWYVPPANNGFTNSAGITWIAQLGGHQGVIGFTGPGAETVALEVDNDPRPDWIKVYWMQFDGYDGAGGVVAAAIREDLGRYQRAIVSEATEPLANGWSQTTIGAYLIPQPDLESVDFSLTQQAMAEVAIDNLYVNSKCIKPPPDEDGDALGDDDATLLTTDLGAATGNNDATAVALTEDLNGVLTFWVAGRSAGGTTHPIYRLDNGGAVVGNTIGLPTATPAPLSVTDLAVARLPIGPGLRREFVVGIVDRRPSQGDVELLFVDSQLATFAPARTVTIPNYAGQPPFGLAFSPHGDLGAGSFWISDQTGKVDEVALSGQILRTLTPALNGTPTGISGAGYDELTGQLYWFSSAPQNTPQGVVQVNGFEHSAYDLRPTGTRFFGDLRVPNPFGPRGGVARGLEVFRRSDGRFALLCVQRTGATSVLTSLSGPYQFGWNLLGRCGMRGDPPMEGATNFRVTLTGVPNARFAMLFAGFSNTNAGGLTLPFNLAAFGLAESNQSISLQLNTTLKPVVNGAVDHVVPLLPPGSGLSYVPMFFQWLVFDPTVPGGIATSQAGKTVIY